jgi:hypothetical protein
MVWMKAWVDKKTSRLRAVKIFPLSEQGQPQTAVGEFILLDDYLDHEGVLVPRQLTFFQVKGGTRAPTLKIRVTKIVLNPPLTGQDFAE